MWDTRFFKSEILDEDRKARPGHTPIWRRDRGWGGYRWAHKKYLFALETGLFNIPCKFRLTCLNDSVVRPVFSVLAANIYTKLHSIFGFLARVTIFLSGVCLSKHFFLYDMIGSLRISLSNGCCCPKCHLLIRSFCKVWRFGTVG